VGDGKGNVSETCGYVFFVDGDIEGDERSESCAMRLRGRERKKNGIEDNLRRWNKVDSCFLKGVGGLSEIYICYDL
jgi:hypothetical protein